MAAQILFGSLRATGGCQAQVGQPVRLHTQSGPRNIEHPRLASLLHQHCNNPCRLLLLGSVQYRQV